MREEGRVRTLVEPIRARTQVAEMLDRYWGELDFQPLSGGLELFGKFGSDMVCLSDAETFDWVSLK